MLVPDLPERQAIGRGDLAGGGPIRGGEHRRQVAGGVLAGADVDERADDRAHHLVAEGVGPDLEAQQSTVVDIPGRLGPAGLHHRAHPRALRLALVHAHAPTERAEVVLTDDVCARGRHRVEVERTHDVPRVADEQRVRRRRVPHVVAVVPPARTEAGVEVVVGPRRGTHGDVGRTELVEPPDDAVEVGAVGQVARHHLTPRVHAGIGAAGARERDRRAHHRRQRVRQHPEHRAHPGVVGEPVEVGPVVGDHQLRSHRGPSSSLAAIHRRRGVRGAVAPWLGGSGRACSPPPETGCGAAAPRTRPSAARSTRPVRCAPCRRGRPGGCRA